jgi:DNA-binding CsgD family transcriptional regulator
MAQATEPSAYIHALEEHLRLAVFGEVRPDDPHAAVLLVRCALAGHDHRRATELALATQALAMDTRADRDMDAAAAHVRGLAERDAVLLERAASAYSAPLASAEATEDAGQAYAACGDHDSAEAVLRRAHDQYDRLGCREGTARVRSLLRAAGVRLHHWRRADRPAFGWASLTETELQIAELVAQGFSNREVAGRVYLSTHTVAFHLRHIFWKLGVGSRVQLARLVAENPGRQAGAAVTLAGSRPSGPNWAGSA